MDELKKVFKGIVIGIIILFVVLLILTTLNIVTFVSVFNWIQHGIYRVTGLDPTLTKGITAIILAGLAMLPFGAIIKSFTPLPQKNKGAFRSIIFVAMSVIFLFIFFGGKKTFFDPSTGEPIKYYIQYPNGKYKISTEPGYDPVTGEELKRVTKDIALELAKLNKAPEPIQPVESFTPVETEPPPAAKPEIVATSEAAPAYESDPIKPVKKVSKPKEEIIDTPHNQPVDNFSSTEYEKQHNEDSYKKYYEKTLKEAEANDRLNQKIAAARNIDQDSETKNDPEIQVYEKTTWQTYRSESPNTNYEECYVTFHNFSLKSVIIYNYSRKEIARISFEGDADLYLRPGKYYLKINSKNSSWKLFTVPDQSSYTINIEKGVSPDTNNNKRIQNNNHVGDEIPAVIYRYYGNYNR